MAMIALQPHGVIPPVGGYAHGVIVPAGAKMLFISGQIPETKDGEVPPEFAQQATAVWQNIKTILVSANMQMSNLVKVTTFLTDRMQAEENGAIRRKFLGDHTPALTVVVAATLDPRWLLEIEAIAVRA